MPNLENIFCEIEKISDSDKWADASKIQNFRMLLQKRND